MQNWQRKCLSHPSLSDDSLWMKDEEFGRQMLNGVNPIVIEKCKTLPSNFEVTNDMVEPFLNQGKTLEEEMKVSQ